MILNTQICMDISPPVNQLEMIFYLILECVWSYDDWNQGWSVCWGFCINLILENKKIEFMSVRCLGVLIFHIFQIDLWKRTVLKLLSTSRFFISATFKRHSIVGPLETFLLYSQMNRTPKKTLSFLFFLLPSNNNNFYTLFAETIFSSSAFMTLNSPLAKKWN